MSTQTTTDISELDVNVDITVAGPDDYIDTGTTAPLPIGSYTLRLLDWGFEPSKTKGKAPAIVLKQVEVAEGPYEGKRLTFQRVYATPFTRKNPITGEEEKASGLGDLIRSFDKSFNTNNMTLPDVKDFLNRQVEQRQTFKAKVDREGFDTDFFNAEAPRRGVAKGDYTSPAAKELNKQATLKGRQHFADSPVAVNPISGNKVESRNRITNFYPSRLD